VAPFEKRKEFDGPDRPRVVPALERKFVRQWPTAEIVKRLMIDGPTNLFDKGVDYLFEEVVDIFLGAQAHRFQFEEAGVLHGGKLAFQEHIFLAQLFHLLQHLLLRLVI
jgi:hypothetical protein